jgi:glycosyltransferase involved in cell wall biosynthesis
MHEITFLTFNYGTAGRYANGPGMCLYNFASILNNAGHKTNIFSILDSPYKEAKKISSIKTMKDAIDRSKVVIHWSGIDSSFAALCSYAKKRGKIVFVGPNVLDCVKPDEETAYIKSTSYDKILTVNERLRFMLSKAYNIPLQKIMQFQNGPNLDIWRPLHAQEKEDFILWKGNSKHFVKDVQFGIDIAKKLKNKYRFEFIGHPKPYDYNEHIIKAKKAKIQIITSLSETMGLAMMEGYASGVPSISHPKIYLHSKNYLTGIITNRTVDDYVQAIDEIMSDDNLYDHMSKGCISFMNDNFSSEMILDKYYKLLESI